MKKILLTLAASLCLSLVARAVPMCPDPVTVTQPDGTTLTLVGHGDEYYHFVTTTDGYTVVQNSDGYYVYARCQEAGRLVPGTMVARDVAQRSGADRQFLSAVSKYLVDDQKSSYRLMKMAQRDQQPTLKQKVLEDYSKFKGLVVLVNFKDRKFTRSDANAHYSHMLNDENYKGYANEDGSYNAYGDMFMGSVRDYFHANSNGHFTPQFDVIGPIDVDWNCEDVHESDNAEQLFLDVVEAAKGQIDFSQYDADGDGVVDMIYFIVAGYGSNFQGNSSGFLWPHKWTLSRSYRQYNGKALGTYACSVELYGRTTQYETILDGIGTICHEFGHVLGLPDFYDTDYGKGGGQSHHPGGWDIMAGGSYYGYARRPVGYTGFERYVLNFATPTVIDHAGSYTLKPVQSHNELMIMRSPVKHEFFVLDNRQNKGWDEQVPGNGMTIYRVDSTNTQVWYSNTINNNPAHNYYVLLRAGRAESGSNAGDAFPGTAGVTSITNLSTPSLCTWNGTPNKFNIIDIVEDGEGNISFNVVEEGRVLKIVEDFEQMPAVTEKNAQNVQGNFAQWTFVHGNVVTPPDSKNREGEHSVQIKKGGVVAMSQPLNFAPFMVNVTAMNASSSTSTFMLQYSTDKGVTWESVSNNASQEVESHDTRELAWTVRVDKPVQYRIVQSGGSRNGVNYLDNIAFVYYPVDGDVNLDGEVNANDATRLVDVVLGSYPAYAPLADQNGDKTIDVSDVTTLTKKILQSKQ